MPVLPQLLLELGSPDLASAARTAGGMLVIYALLQFVCGPLIGNLSDRFGRRPVILFSLLAFGLDYLLMGIAPTIAWLFVGRAIAGVAGAVQVPANAFVADVTPPGERARAFGIVSASTRYRASGSGLSWNFITLLVVPFPPSMWNGARVLTVAHRPRPFQPAPGSSMRPSSHFV